MSKQDIAGSFIEDQPEDTPKTESQKVVDRILLYIRANDPNDLDPYDLDNIVADAMRATSEKAQEECAKIAEGLDSSATCPMCPRDVAAAIRAVELE